MTTPELVGITCSGPAKVWFQGANVEPAGMGRIEFKWLPSDPYAIEIHVTGPHIVSAMIDVDLVSAAIADADGKFHRGAAGSAVGVCSRMDVFGLVIEVTDGAVFALMKPDQVMRMDTDIKRIRHAHVAVLQRLVEAEIEALLEGGPDVQE